MLSPTKGSKIQGRALSTAVRNFPQDLVTDWLQHAIEAHSAEVVVTYC